MHTLKQQKRNQELQHECRILLLFDAVVARFLQNRRLPGLPEKETENENT